MNLKYLGKSTTYKHVYKMQFRDGFWWMGRVLGGNKRFIEEREAALWVDKKLIENNKNPVNILKRKDE